MDAGDTPRWSFITVSYNSAADLREHWAQELPPTVEWIVVDNASVDDSVARAQELGARVVQLEENLGFGAANNRGFEQARGEFIAFVNPDVEVDFTSLSVLERSLRREPGVIAPQLAYPDGSLQPSGRSAPSLLNKVFSRLGRREVVDSYHIYVADDEERYVGWMTGAAVVSARTTFSLLGRGGPWDERFFVYYEDSDLGLRAWQLGLTVRVIGSSRWVHSWARATTRVRIRPWLLELDSMWKFYTRYPSLVMGSGGRLLRRERTAYWGRLVETAQGEAAR